LKRGRTDGEASGGELHRQRAIRKSDNVLTMKAMILTQSRRLLWAFILALLLALQLFIEPLHQVFSSSEPFAAKLSVVRSLISILFVNFVLIHLGLYWWWKVAHGTGRFQFTMMHLLVCSIGACVLIGLNFVSERYPILSLHYVRSPLKSDPLLYGFPFEILRVHGVKPPNSERTVINLSGVFTNAVVLLLFMANVLVLKFGKSENVASAPVSASSHAPH
jgi:hypothetical protein